MTEKRLCGCGCGKELTGAKQQRRLADCKARVRLERQRRWREARRDDPEYRRAQRERAAAFYNADPEKNRERMRLRARAANRRDRTEAIKAYGGSCTCCGEERTQFLTLHHVNGDGGQHRKELVGASHRTSANGFIRRLRAAGFPKAPYEIAVLCWNCHMAEEFFGACPHREGR